MKLKVTNLEEQRIVSTKTLQYALDTIFDLSCGKEVNRYKLWGVEANLYLAIKHAKRPD